MTNLQHIINGGKLLPNGNPISSIKLSSVTLIDKNDGITEQYDFNDLNQIEDNFTIYFSPEDQKITELENTIARLEEKLLAKDVESSTHKHHVHLSKAEVAEIEQIFIDKPNTELKLIISTYNSSRTVIDRIFNGTHSKSSSVYTAHRLTK